MQFSGFQKLTLLDYPEKTACTLFTAGCNFRCPFCHNAALVTHIDNSNYFTEEYVLDYLKKRKGVIDGVCITGGEPLMQPEFTLALLKLAKENGLHTCIETSGFGKWEVLEEIAPYVDIFLYDFKIGDSTLHKKYTGVENGLIIDNLKKLDEMGAKTVLRCPIIPDINDNESHFESILSIANSLNNLLEINLEPYHPLGISKQERLNKESKYTNREFMDKEKLKSLAGPLVENANVKVKIM